MQKNNICSKKIKNDIDLIIYKHKKNLKKNAELAGFSKFKTGGKAQLLFAPEDEQELQQFLQICPEYIPVTVMGLASNIIIRDAGVKGVVIKLGGKFNEIEILEHGEIKAGTAVPCPVIAKKATQNGIANLQFYAGIPGSFGGAITMNAGIPEIETKQVLVKVRYIDRKNIYHEIKTEKMNYQYRKCGFWNKDIIFTQAIIKGEDKYPVEKLQERMQQYINVRKKTQPIGEKTAGSTFKNPYGQKAWRLIEKAKCKGMKIGGARISELHCNFIINDGNATSADIENLANEVQKKVWKTSKVKLQWEIKCIGDR